MNPRTLMAGAAMIVAFAALLALVMLSRCYADRERDLVRERNNAEARADTLREVADGWEQRALTMEEVAAFVSDSMRAHIAALDRQVRAVANVTAQIEDRVDVVTEAVARGDSTRIDWAHSDSAVDLSVALAFPGMVRPDPTPPVTGTAQFSARVDAELIMSCDPQTGAPFANATVLDDRVAITALDVVVDDRVSCLSLKNLAPVSFEITRPNLPWLAGGAALGFWLGRR